MGRCTVSEKPVRYLRLIGRLRADNRLDLRPGYLTSTPRFWRREPEGPLRAEMSDADDRVLLRQGVPAAPYCFGAGTTRDLAVWADLAFPEGTRRIRFFRDDVLVHTIEVQRRKPRLSLTWSPPARVSGKRRVTWRAKHPDGAPLEFLVRYSHDNGETWRRVGKRTAESGATIDFRRLSGGERCRIAVLATDGANTVLARSKAFAVPVKGCKATIASPADGERVAVGELVVLQGQGFHVEAFEIELDDLVWISDRDGELGHGPVVPVRDLSRGRHVLTLTAGGGKRDARASVTIRVGR